MVLKIENTEECSRMSKQYAEGVRQMSEDVHKLCLVLGELPDVGNNFSAILEKLQDCDKILNSAAGKAEEADTTMRRFIDDYERIQNTQLRM